MEARGSDLVHLNWLKDIGSCDFKNKSILDLGCGSGYLCQYALDHQAVSAVGVDMVEPKGIDTNISWKFKSLNLDHPDWATDIQQETRQFDCILAFDIIEHLRSPWDFLKNCKSLLQDQGELIITTPNINSWERLKNPSNWSGVVDEQHKTLFSPYSLKFMLEKTGLSDVETHAPVNKLRFLGSLVPKIGGQILTKSIKPGHS